MKDFKEQLQNGQTDYKENSLKIKKCGLRKGKSYPHILPEDAWPLNLWEGISYQTIEYFAQKEIAWHKEKHNMLSSQIMCVNLFFPLKQYPNTIKPWLAKIYPDIQNVVGIDFEYIGPENYFREKGGRGQNRTSSDVSIEWKDKQDKKNLLLLEFKFTEPDFGNCSKSNNSNRSRCYSSEKVVASPQTQCYRVEVGRTYWDIILSTDSPLKREFLTTEPYCPFRYDFYQLMRNQLLAHRIQQEKIFNKAEFGAIYHADNDKLLRMSHKFGEERNPLKAWPTLLKNPDTFHVLTIQGYLNSVETGLPNELKDWREYIKQRYGV